MEAAELIVLKDMTKRYGKTCVLSSISLSIREGESIAIRGSNGTGKSTLLKIIAGFIPLSAGERSVQQSGLKIGYAPDRLPQLRMTSTEYLTYMGRIAGIAPHELSARIKELHEMLHLEQKPSLRMTYYSKGMLQKVNLMQAILRVPDVLILDEPLSGLDKASVTQLLLVLKQLKEEGTSILAAIHDSLLSRELDSRSYWIKDGRLTLASSDEHEQGTVFIYEATCPLHPEALEQIMLRLPTVTRMSNERSYILHIQEQDYLEFLQLVVDYELTLFSLERKELQS